MYGHSALPLGLRMSDQFHIRGRRWSEDTANLLAELLREDRRFDLGS